MFSQQGSLRLISHHQVQKGPAFPDPTDILVTVATGEVKIRSRGSDGKEQVETHHLELSPDLGNGIVLNLVKNLASNMSDITIPYLLPTKKPQLGKLSIAATGEDSFLVAGYRRTAMRYTIKVDIGGIKGIVAPLIGKQPADINVWIAQGEVPAFVKMEGPLYAGGPTWRVEMAAPVWPSSTQKTVR